MNDETTITIDWQVVNKVLLVTTPVLAVLTFSPVTVDSFDLPKGIVMFFLSGLLLLSYLLKSLADKKLDLINSVFNLPVLLFALCSFLSTLVPVNKFLGLSDFALTFLPFLVIYFAVAHAVKEEVHLKSAFAGLGLAVAVLAGFNIFTNLYALISRFATGLPAINLISPLFSPAGSVFAQVILFVIIAPLVVSQFKEGNKIFWGIVLGLVAVSGLLSLNTLFSNRPVLLDYQSSWKIATGALGSSLLSAIVGAGYNQFQNVFTMYKPLEFNLSGFWNLKFSSAGSYYLTVLATSGIAGLAALSYIVTRFMKTARLRMSLNVARPTEYGLLGSISAAFVLFVFFPASNLALFILFYLLGLLTAYYRLREVTAIAQVSNRSFSPLLFFPALAVFAGVAYYLIARLFLADYNFQKSLSAVAQNRGADAYNLQIKAIELNPFNDAYRTSYSQTNIALADAIAGTATPGGQLSEAQKNNVVQLVQQGIREARTATALNPLRSANWENLAIIYKSLINFAQGADQWTVSSQNQAITLDPTNPRLRLDLGGLFLAAGQYNTAAQAFSLATQLKPDYANAYYNLAQAYKMLKNNDFYKQNLQMAKNLVCPVNPSDCDKINNELAEVEKSEQTMTQLTGTNQTATEAAQPNLPKVRPSPPPEISSPSGELNP